MPELRVKRSVCKNSSYLINIGPPCKLAAQSLSTGLSVFTCSQLCWILVPLFSPWGVGGGGWGGTPKNFDVGVGRPGFLQPYPWLRRPRTKVVTIIATLRWPSCGPGTGLQAHPLKSQYRFRKKRLLINCTKDKKNIRGKLHLPFLDTLLCKQNQK